MRSAGEALATPPRRRHQGRLGRAASTAWVRADAVWKGCHNLSSQCIGRGFQLLHEASIAGGPVCRRRSKTGKFRLLKSEHSTRLESDHFGRLGIDQKARGRQCPEGPDRGAVPSDRPCANPDPATRRVSRTAIRSRKLPNPGYPRAWTAQPPTRTSRRRPTSPCRRWSTGQAVCTTRSTRAHSAEYNGVPVDRRAATGPASGCGHSPTITG